MKKERVYLDELHPYSSSYVVWIRVLRKGHVQTSPCGGVVFQVILLEDDKGNRMKAVLLGCQVERLGNAISCNQVYEITNAKIIPNDSPWKSGASELNFQMSLDGGCIFKPVMQTLKTDSLSYSNITQLRMGGVGSQEVDVLAVVLYVEPNFRMVSTCKGESTAVREVVVTDQSSATPLYITLLDELAKDSCLSTSPWAESFPVVSLAGLISSPYRGYSLATSMITTVSQHPIGAKPQALREWACENKRSLVERLSDLLQAINPRMDKDFLTIAALQQKMVMGTFKGGRCWLNATVQQLTMDQLEAYVGCSFCGGPTSCSAGHVFPCVYCLGTESIACHCVTLSCNVFDATGVLPIKAWTEMSEILLRLPAPDIFKMKTSEDADMFNCLCDRLSSYQVQLEIAVRQLDSRYPTWQWALTRLEFPISNMFYENPAADSIPNSVFASDHPVYKGITSSSNTSHLLESFRLGELAVGTSVYPDDGGAASGAP